LKLSDIEYGSVEETVLKLKLARHFQKNESIDTNVLYDAVLETPHFISKDKGSLNRLFDIHQQKTLIQIAETRKRRAEMTGEEGYNPYEALFETDSGKYYMARLLNMPHLEDESAYMKNCVGTSNSYFSQMKSGKIDVLSFRHTPTMNQETNTLEGDTPVLTIQYNRTTKVIEQIKKYDDKYLNQDEPYFEDVIDALSKLRDTLDEKGKQRNFKNIAASEMEEIDVSKNHILTSKGEISIAEYDPNDSEQFILKADTFEITNETPIELVQKACLIPGLQISFESLEVAKEVFDGSIMRVEGDLDLSNLRSAEGLRLPDHVAGNLYLNSLSSAEGLRFPDHVGGYLNLCNLSSAEGLTLPDHVGGDLYLRSLSSAEGLRFPDHVGGGLYLDGLSSAEGLKLPDHVGGYLDLYNLSSAEGLKLPDHVGGYLDLCNLSSAEGLTLPDHVGGDLYLRSLSSAEGLKLPDHVGGDLYLNDLSSAEGLTLPDHVGGYLNLYNLSPTDKALLREKYPQHAQKI